MKSMLCVGIKNSPVDLGLRGKGLLFVIISLALLCSLSFSSCNGTGGVSDSVGATYSSSSPSGSSSAGGMTDSSGSELSALDIMNMMSGGHADDVEVILSGVDADAEEERGTFEVVLSASDLGLPEDGWVELEVAGDAYFKGTAFAGPDGTVRFTVPRQRIGAILSVSLTAYLPDGNPYTSGNKTGPAEEGSTNIFSVPLVDLPSITISITGNKSSYGRTVEQDGVSYDVLEYTGSVLGMVVTSSDSEATLDTTLNGTECGDSESLSDGFNTIEVIATKSAALPTVTAKKYVYVVKALTEDDIEITYPNKKDEGTDSDGHTVFRYRYSQDDNLKLTVTNKYTGDNDSTGGHSSMEVTVNGDTFTDDSSVADKILVDGSNSISVTLSKPLCEDVTVTKTVYAGMRPIKVKLNGNLRICFHTTDPLSDNSLELCGDIYIGVNPHGAEIDSTRCTWYHLKDLGDGGSWKEDGWDSCGHKNPDVWIYNKDDKLCYETRGMYEGDTSPDSDDAVRDVRNLSISVNLKNSSASMSIDSNDYGYNGGDRNEHEADFILSDNY